MRLFSALRSWVAPKAQDDGLYFSLHPGIDLIMETAECDPVWPDDPDEVPAWVLKAEAVRAAAGITDRLPARTKSEFARSVEIVEAQAAATLSKPVESKPVLSIELRPQLSTADAARRFLAAIQHDEIVGEYTAPELSALYSQFCADHNLTPSPVDHVKAELAHLPGVHRQQVATSCPETGKRRRNWMWIITPMCEMATLEHDPFVTDESEPEPIRLAA